MCLACAAIEEELAEQERLDAQLKLHAMDEAALPTHPVATGGEQQE
jgi:hypothetical protein